MLYTNTFLDVEVPIDMNDIKRIEGELGIDLPDELRRHYLQYNGGHPERRHFWKDDILYSLHQFLPMRHSRGALRFEDAYIDQVLRERIIPDYLVPFADDPGGDFYCMVARGSTAGAIVIVRDEYVDDDPERVVQPVSESLEHFINGMVDRD